MLPIFGLHSAPYERLHGPSADYVQNLSRDGLGDLLLQAVHEACRLPALAFDGADDNEMMLNPNHADDLQSTAAMVRSLRHDGWVEVCTALGAYHAHAQADEQFNARKGLDSRNGDFSPVYAQMIALLDQTRAQLLRQKDIGLGRNLEQLHTTALSFNDVFY